MAGFGDFIGKAGSSAEQLFIWGVLQQVIGQLGLPYFQALAQATLASDPNTPLDPPDAAGLAARKLLTEGHAEDQAKKSGLDPDLTAVLIQAARRAPDLSSVFELYRRQLIEAGSDDPTETSVRGALTDAGIRDGWHPLVEKLATSLPTGAEIMNAWLEGQISRGEAQRRWQQAGGDPSWFQTAYNANGQAPTPVEALDLLNRGIIPEKGTGPDAVTYEQAFLEGPWRNKWLDSFLALRYYYPPPRTVTAMYHDGQLTHEQAAQYLTKQGLDQTLVQAYLAPAATSKTTADKQLAKTDILSLYRDKLLTKAEARKALETLHYSPHDATLILELDDLRDKASQLKAGTTRARTLFEAGKLSEHDAIDVLVQLGVDRAQARQTVDIWSITQAATTRTLTAAEIVGAWYYDVISADAAMHMLQRLGYDAFDAYVMLSVRNHGPLQDVPRPPSPYPPPPPLTPPTPPATPALTP